MGNRTIVPFGPQHPVLPEPIHLDLVLEDETVVEAILELDTFTEAWKSWWKKEIISSIVT